MVPGSEAGALSGQWLGRKGTTAAALPAALAVWAKMWSSPSLPLYLGWRGSAVTASQRTGGSLFLMNQFSQGGEGGGKKAYK